MRIDFLAFGMITNPEIAFLPAFLIFDFICLLNLGCRTRKGSTRARTHSSRKTNCDERHKQEQHVSTDKFHSA
jgi:hypothetical protein